MKKRLVSEKGSSMLLVICIFLVLSVLGINLLNAANANVSNTKSEYDKEQTMLYVSSIYEIVNKEIENGLFFDSATNLPDQVTVKPGQGFKDKAGADIGVKITFRATTLPIEADITISCKNAQGVVADYTIRSTYSRIPGNAKLVRETCKGLVDE